MIIFLIALILIFIMISKTRKAISEDLWNNYLENPCDETRNEFVESYVPYVGKICYSLYNGLGRPGNTSVEEFNSFAFEGLLKYLDKHRNRKPDGGKIIRLILDRYRSESGIRNKVKSGMRFFDDFSFIPIEDSGWREIDERDSFNGIIRGFDNDEKLVMKLRYVEDLSFEDIGNAIGVCDSRAFFIHNKVLDSLKRRYKVN